MLRTSIPNPYPRTKPKRALSPQAQQAFGVLLRGGSCKRHGSKPCLLDEHGARHRWFTSVHLKELHSFGLVEPTTYVQHAPTEWTLTALGRVVE